MPDLALLAERAARFQDSLLEETRLEVAPTKGRMLDHYLGQRDTTPPIRAATGETRIEMRGIDIPSPGPALNRAEVVPARLVSEFP